MAADPINYLPSVLAVAKETAAGILDIYQKSRQFAVKAKTDTTPLTQGDLIAHEIVVAGLQKITPTIPILSEEGAEIAYAERQKWQRYWLVDPLDGTKEFLRHSGEFSINIALIENQRAILGMIYAPVTDQIYFAVQNHGAFKQKLQEEPKPIHVKPWSSEKITVMVGQGYKLEKLKSILGRFSDYEILSMGSALKFGLIAEGKADLYPRFGKTSEWDTAAGQIIIEEAGGAVVDLALKPLRYNTKASLLNPPFFALGDAKKLMQQLKNFVV